MDRTVLPSRRAFLAAGAGLVGSSLLADSRKDDLAADTSKALIAITLDLEMSRNFPTWETTHWDYEKGNLDAATKEYAEEACRRVKARGGVIHCFAVGRVLEQENINWLKEIVKAGWGAPKFYYNRVADDVAYQFAIALSLDNMDDHVYPVIYRESDSPRR